MHSEFSLPFCGFIKKLNNISWLDRLQHVGGMTSSDILFYKLFKIIPTGAGASASIQRISRFNPKNFNFLSL